MKNIGFVVNPYAGMGGAVGLKGTDGCIKKAEEMGAIKTSPSRAVRFLNHLSREDIRFFSAGGIMGEEELQSSGKENYEIVYSPMTDETSSEDTIQACRAMRDAEVDLIIFSGGDGTARDVYSITGHDIPILGIPSGVKIYSGVFATSPESAALLISDPDNISLSDGEIMDVNEEDYREGVLNTCIYGIAPVPYIPILTQSSKQVFFGDEHLARRDIAAFIIDIMRDDTLYLLGAGSTTEAIAQRLGIRSTLLGIDAIYQKKKIASDLNEQGILSLLERFDKIKIIISPIGAQGFILGRGNQQISVQVLKKAGLDSLIVVATPLKLQNTPRLYIDTNDQDFNQEFQDSILVICGYEMGQRIKLSH